MELGQSVIHNQTYSYLPHQVINLDETALNWAIGPTHMYIPAEIRRAESEVSTDEKARVTLVPAIDAAGCSLPLYFIIKHTVAASETDLTSVRVIKALNQKPGFTRAEGWQHKLWQRTIGGNNWTIQYLHNIHTGHIVTSQHKAWNDTPRMAMYIDLILKPQKAARGGKLAVWMDNCKIHKTVEMMALFAEAGYSTLRNI